MMRCHRTRATVFVLFAVAAAAPAQAAVFTVTKTADTLDGACDRDCSLREAIAAANDSAGPDVILLGIGTYTLTRAGAGEDDAATGDLDVLGELALIGEGPGQTVLDGAALDRVLDVHGDANLEIRGVTIRNGRVTGNGGGILNAGRLTISQSLVTANRTAPSGSGGGISSPDAFLTVTDSTISSNQSDGPGGGIAAGGQMTLANVTISGNTARIGDGGGIYALADLDGNVNNTTIANNSAGRGGGIFAESSPFIAIRFPHVRNSILAGNQGSTPEDRDCSGAVASDGYNLLGIGDACIDFRPDKNDREGTAAAPLDPRLSSLGGNGGLTPTHALHPNSPAINAGNPATPGSGGSSCEPFDQRGVARTDRCDIGAFEASVTGCFEGATTLCLQSDRFEVTATFRTRQGLTGPAQAVELTPDSGYFTFFGANNVEVTVKVLDGCPSNNRFWVFIAGMTDVEVTVTVRDTLTGVTKTYSSPLGRPFQPVLDTRAFPTCAAH